MFVLHQPSIWSISFELFIKNHKEKNQTSTKFTLLKYFLPASLIPCFPIYTVLFLDWYKRILYFPYHQSQVPFTKARTEERQRIYDREPQYEHCSKIAPLAAPLLYTFRKLSKTCLYLWLRVYKTNRQVIGNAFLPILVLDLSISIQKIRNICRFGSVFGNF